MNKNQLIRQIAFLVSLSVSVEAVNAQEINLGSLGLLQLTFEKIKKITHIPSEKTLAKVEIKRGEAYILTTPTNVQQLSYLVNNGEKLIKGQPFAVLRGPEVHHFLSELNAIRSLFELSKQRLINSKKLFEKNLIEEGKWLEINQNYHSDSLEYEHMMHFYELITSIDEKTDSITIKSPISGVLSQTFSENRMLEQVGIAEGDVIASIVPLKAMRINMHVPLKNAAKIEYLELSQCRLKVDSISNVSQGAFVELWSEAIGEECQLMLGQTQTATPFLKQTAFQISKKALFELEGKDYILIRSKQKLKSIEVFLLNSVADNYYFTTSVSLANVDVLTSSVSAIQGILLGLGGE